MKKMQFKGSITRPPIETGKFSMLSMYDSIIYFDYLYRFEQGDKVYKLRLILDVDGFKVLGDCDRENNEIFNVPYYRMLYNELKSNDVKTQCDLFKLFSGMVFESPVKLA